MTKHGNKTSTILNIGCGDTKIEGAIGLDVRKTESVDIIADARFLPFKDEVFDHVYSSHIIEHFSHGEVKNVVRNWVGVLKKGGIIEVRCPWLRARAFIFFLKPTWENMIDIYGGQGYNENFHKCGFSFKLLKNLLEECGVHKVRRVIRGYKGIPFIPDCLQVRGLKNRSSQIGISKCSK